MRRGSTAAPPRDGAQSGSSCSFCRRFCSASCRATDRGRRSLVISFLNAFTGSRRRRPLRPRQRRAHHRGTSWELREPAPVMKGRAMNLSRANVPSSPSVGGGAAECSGRAGFRGRWLEITPRTPRHAGLRGAGDCRSRLRPRGRAGPARPAESPTCSRAGRPGSVRPFTRRGPLPATERPPRGGQRAYPQRLA